MTKQTCQDQGEKPGKWLALSVKKMHAERTSAIGQGDSVENNAAFRDVSELLQVRIYRS